LNPKFLPETFNRRLQSLLLQMLHKNPKMRPSLEDTNRILNKVLTEDDNKPSILKSLEAIHVVETKKQMKISSELAEQQRKLVQRDEDAKDALLSLMRIIGNLVKILEEQIPSIVINTKHPLSTVAEYRLSHEVSCGPAKLDFSYFGPSVPIIKATAIPDTMFPRSKWDVITAARISVTQNLIRPRLYVWSTSLFYTNLGIVDGNYDWYEVAFFRGLSKLPLDYEPSSIADFLGADLAISQKNQATMSEPCRINLSDSDTFIERWLSLFSLAYSEQLHNIPLHYKPITPYCDNSFLKGLI
jgi:hypothetical protein